MTGSMLPYPLMDWDVKEALVKVAADAEGQPEMILEQALSHLLYHALMARAKAAGKKVSADFSLGAALWAAIQAREALWRIEQEALLPLCDLDLHSDVIYEEIEAFGRRAPENFDHAHNAFRF